MNSWLCCTVEKYALRMEHLNTLNSGREVKTLICVPVDLVMNGMDLPENGQFTLVREETMRMGQSGGWIYEINGKEVSYEEFMGAERSRMDS